MNRRQYSNQGFRRQSNFERPRFNQNNNPYGLRFPNPNINNNRIRRNYQANKNNRRTRNSPMQLRNVTTNKINRRRPRPSERQETNKHYLRLGLRSSNARGNNNNNQRKRRRNVNTNIMKKELPKNNQMRRQGNRTIRRSLQNKQKKKDEGLLYLYNLSPETINTDLKEIFEPYGRLKRCAVFFDLNTHISKERGVIQFTSKVNAQKAMNDLNGKILSF